MKVIVLGGAGDVGSRAAEEIATTPGTTLLTIADRNEDAAKLLQKKLLENSRVKCEVRIAIVDAFVHHSLVSAIEGHDVAASALGPFHLFEEKCARASIDAKVNYCSVCDDYNAAEDVLDKLQAVAQRNGVIVITGFGATPGTSNIAASIMASHMDVATDVHISCFQPLNAGGGEAVLRHMLFVLSGQLPVWRDGRRVVVPACSSSKKVEFPKYGNVTVWTMGHAEPVTLHRYMPTLRNVEYKMGFGFGSRCLIWPSYYLGLFRFKVVVTVTIWFFSWLDLLFKKWPKGNGALRVDVYGIKNGKPCHEMACGVGEMREVTGVSLAVGALMLGSRVGISVSGGGVFAPEGSVDSNIFHNWMADKGFKSFSNLEMTIPFTGDSLA